MGIVVIGDVFIDVKGYSTAPFIPGGRNAGVIQQLHGGVGRNVAEDIANIELEACFVSLVMMMQWEKRLSASWNVIKWTPDLCVRFLTGWEPGWLYLTRMEM